MSSGPGLSIPAAGVETPAALPPVAETTDPPIAEAEVAAPPVTGIKVANPPVAETVDPLGDLRQARGWIDYMLHFHQNWCCEH